MPSTSRRILTALVLAQVLAVSGCATILGGGTSQPVSFTSDPNAANFTVKSSSGLQMASGRAPQTLTLPRRNEYQIEFAVPGYESQSVALTKGVNGWVWGNLLIGWFVGFAVDFMTGAAYKLEPATVQVALVRQADDAGVVQLYGVVRQLDIRNRVLREQRVLLQPVR